MKIFICLLLISCNCFAGCEDKTFAGIPTTSESTVILCRSSYVNVYSTQCKIPIVVIEWLTIKHNETSSRVSFHVDPNLIATERSTNQDYTNSGYDKGHLAAAANFKHSTIGMYESFYLSNTAPQEPKLNRGVWRLLEEHTRALAAKYDGVWVYTGTIINNATKTIGDHVCVPTAFFKIIIIPKTRQAIAYMIPNTSTITGHYEQYKYDIRDIEVKSGVNLFNDYKFNDLN